MEENENKYKLNSPQFEKGDKIQLGTKNFKIKRLSKRFDYIKDGLFRIAEIRGLINYKLELPPDAKIYPVFYILLLEKAPDYLLVATRMNYKLKKENIYKVEKILKEKNNQYFIK